MSIKIHEALILKKFIDIKISDIKLKMKVCQDDKLAVELFALLDKVQNYTRSITESNMKTKINVGKTKTDVDTVVRIRGTLKHKIDIVSDFINNDSINLDVITLLKQRDDLVDEFVLLDRVIKKVDLETEID
jgi:hypothetical protein